MQKLRGKGHVFPLCTAIGYKLRNVGKTVHSSTEEKYRKREGKREVRWHLSYAEKLQVCVVFSLLMKVKFTLC